MTTTKQLSIRHITPTLDAQLQKLADYYHRGNKNSLVLELLETGISRMKPSGRLLFSVDCEQFARAYGTHALIDKKYTLYLELDLTLSTACISGCLSTISPTTNDVLHFHFPKELTAVDVMKLFSPDGTNDSTLFLSVCRDHLDLILKTHNPSKLLPPEIYDSKVLCTQIQASLARLTTSPTVIDDYKEQKLKDYLKDNFVVENDMLLHHDNKFMEVTTLDSTRTREFEILLLATALKDNVYLTYSPHYLIDDLYDILGIQNSRSYHRLRY